MHRNYIGGRFVESPNDEKIKVLNPATGQVISEIPDSREGAVDEAVAAAKRVQPSWAQLPAIVRAGYLRRIATKLREKAAAFAHIISEEQGKILSLSGAEVAFAANYLDYMAEWARRIEGEIIQSDRPGETIFLFREPIGVVGGILPWNFPLFLIVRKMGPALITGNTIVIKPSEETPNDAALFAEIVAESDLPDGVFNLVYGRGAITGKALAAHPDVGLISFTGSVSTGSAIMASAARNITKVNLELGGKAPAIVMADADVDLAVKAVKASRVINSGQACNCAERVYVDAPIAEEFTSKLTAAMMETSYGNPLGNKSVDMGPLINEAAVEKVSGLVDRAVADGAKILVGGSPDHEGGGCFFQPTVLGNCRQGMEIMREEIFGPVIPVEIIHGLDEAINRANDSRFGLTSSIYTRDLSAALRACNEIRFGETYINRENFEALQGFHAGARQSGIGGADGKHGLLEFTQTHVVYMQN